MLGTVPAAGQEAVQTQTTPSATPGVASTSGAANADGSWVQLGSDLTFELTNMLLRFVAGTAPSAADSRALGDIGVDLAGGTSFTEIVSDLLLTGTSSNVGQARLIRLPIRVPSGASIAFRHRAALASDVIRVQAMFVGASQYPWQAWSADICDTYGAVAASSDGTAIGTGSIGASGAEGSWVQITAATLRDHIAIMPQLAVGAGDTNWSGRGYLIDIGYDQAGGSSYIPLITDLDLLIDSSEITNGIWPAEPLFATIPQGSSLAVRASSSGTAVDALAACLYCFS